MAELKPCPHCGGKSFTVQMDGVFQVWCRRDLCARGPMRGSEAEAITAWNTRVIPGEGR